MRPALVAALLVGGCGSRSDAGAFEQAVVAANMEFDYCFTGVYSPPDEFTYSEGAALSACRGLLARPSVRSPSP